MRIHFWERETPESSFWDWDPDEEPQRYPTGVGHAVLELGWRLERWGHAVTVGPDIQPGAALCVHLESLWRWSGEPDWKAIAQFLLCAQNAGTVTIIRGDVPLSFRAPLADAVEVMPNRPAVKSDRQVWIPLLPQRGLEPRASARRGRVQTVAVLAYAINEPAYFRSQRFAEELAARDVTLVRRVWDRAGDIAPRWHDLSDVDVVLCVADDPSGIGLPHKPPTKLVNAWAAGSIPIVATNQPGYTDLAKDGQTAVFVDRPEDVPAALDRLADPTLVRVVEHGIARAAVEYETASVLRKWEHLLMRRPHGPVRVPLATEARAQLMAATVLPRAAARRRLAQAALSLDPPIRL